MKEANRLSSEIVGFCVGFGQIADVRERTIRASVLQTHHFVTFGSVEQFHIRQFVAAEPWEDIDFAIISTIFVGLEGVELREHGTGVNLPAYFC